MKKIDKFTEIPREPRIGSGHPHLPRVVKNPKGGNSKGGKKK